MSLSNPPNLARLFYQQNYAQLYEATGAVSPDSPVYEASKIWLIRGLIDQGHMVEAKEHLDSFRPKESLYKLLRELYLGYLTCLQGNMEQGLADLNEAIFQHRTRELTHTEEALLADFSQRINWVWIAIGRRDRSFWQQTAQATEAIFHQYRIAQEPAEAWLALLRATDACLKSPFADYGLTQQWISQVIEETNEHPLFQGRAYLVLGKLHFQQMLHGPKVATDEEIWAFFQKSSTLLAQGGHSLAEAKPTSTLASMLLTVGAKEGVVLAQQALSRLREVNQLTDQQNLWRDLQRWHLLRGEADSADSAAKQSQALSEQIGLQMTHQVDQLGEADTAFRRGEVNYAISILKPLALHKPPLTVSQAAASLLATMLGQVNRAKEAIPDLKELIHNLKQEGHTPQLAQTYFILHTCYPPGDEQAIEALSESLRTYQALEDTLETGNILIQRAWQLFIRAYRTQGKNLKEIPEASNQDFETARALLLPIRHLSAMQVLGNLCQQWGQCYFILKDYQSCGHWLSQAEALYRQMELPQGLSFTLTMQGLVFLEIGRKAGPATYDQAQIRFQEAGRMFEELGLGALAWRMAFFQGLADYEAGQLETAPELQEKRWARTQKAYRHASELIDQLRGDSGNDFSGSGQLGLAQFSIDKQSFLDSSIRFAWQNQDEEALLWWLETLKGRSLLNTLANSAHPPSSIEKESLVQRELTLRRKKQQAVNAKEALSQEKAIRQLLEQMAQNPATRSYASLRKGKIMEWATIKGWLQLQEKQHSGRAILLISYYLSPDLCFVLGMRSGWEAPKQQRIYLDRKRFSETIQTYFRTPGGLRTALSDFGPEPWEDFQEIVQPISFWSNPGDLVGLIPFGDLHDLPLHTLPIEGMPLIQRNPIFYLPSLSLLSHLPQQSVKARKDSSIAIFGDPQENLPSARKEVASLASLWNVKPLLGAEISPQSLNRAMSETGIFHFAGHGEVSAEDGLESSLLLSGDKHWRAEDILGIHSTVHTAVLSACETGLSQHLSGDELFGFVRAFILSGVNSLIVSQWRVHDKSTQTLLTLFYQQMRKHPSMLNIEALQRATLALRDMPDYHSLYFWAPFVHVGFG